MADEHVRPSARMAGGLAKRPKAARGAFVS